MEKKETYQVLKRTLIGGKVYDVGEKVSLLPAQAKWLCLSGSMAPEEYKSTAKRKKGGGDA